MWKIWTNKLLPKALKSCPKSNKSPDLVTLTTTILIGLLKHTFDIHKVSPWSISTFYLQNIRISREHSPWGEVSLYDWLASSFTRLDLTKKENMWLLACNDAVESNIVKLEAGCTVILPPTAIALRNKWVTFWWIRLRYNYLPISHHLSTSLHR